MAGSQGEEQSWAIETHSDQDSSQLQLGGMHSDTWRYIAPLVRLAQDVYGTTHGIGDRFSREVIKVTRGRAQVFLSRDEEWEPSRFSVVGLVLPMWYAGIRYGNLVVTPREGDAHEFGIPLDVCAQLAKTYAWLLHLLNEGAVLRFQSQHLETTATRGEDLSRRQHEVLTRMVYGQDRETIARELRITAATVDSHRQAVYERLGARSTIEAILIAHRTGRVRCIDLPGVEDLKGAPALSGASHVGAGGKLLSGRELHKSKLPSADQDNAVKNH